MRPVGRRSVVWPAFILSLAYTLRLLGWGFISGRGPYWDHLELWDLDRAQALIGWRYFAHDAWRFPLFWVPSLSYPEGTNIIFTDSIPLVAAAFKLIRQSTGIEIDYFGFWMAACYVMQGVAAALLLHALGVRTRLGNLCGVLVALCAPILLGRFGHGALCAHFLILLTLTSYFEILARPNAGAPWGFLIAAPAAALLITSYLGVMLAALTAATALECWRRGRARGIAFAAPFAMAVVAVVTMFVSGMIGPSAPSPVGSGYGHFSMNLLAPLFGGPESYTQRLFGPVAVDATGGQYEGFNYLGIGVLALGAVSLVANPRDAWRSVREHPVLVVTLLALSLYALGDRVFWGATEIVKFDLPAVATRIAGAFRSSGRFFWPSFYMLTLGLISSVHRRLPPPAALAVLATVAAVQFLETAPLRASVFASARAVHTAHFVDTQVAALAERAERLFVYPSYECTRDDPAWPHPESWRAAVVELMLHTSHRTPPSNSSYVSRGRKDCDRERAALPHERLEPGTLYVVRKADAGNFASDVGPRAECLETSVAVLCQASDS